MPAMPSPSPSRPMPGPAHRRLGAGVRPASVLALLLACLASACGPADTEFPPVCPSLTLVPDAGDLTRFNGQGHDVTNLVVQARVTKVPAKCEPGDRGIVRAILHVEGSATRGLAGAGASAPIDYFVALMRDDKVLQEQDFVLSPTFAPNVDRTSLHGEDVELLLPVGKNNSAAAYRIYVGFRLTQDELAYNRSHRAP